MVGCSKTETNLAIEEKQPTNIVHVLKERSGFSDFEVIEDKVRMECFIEISNPLDSEAVVNLALKSLI